MPQDVLADEPTTGRPWVDLLSISTLVMYRPDFNAARLDRPPAGWTVAAQSQWTVTWVRNHPVPTAGGVVSTSAGVRVSNEQRGTRSVQFRVDRVPAGGGTVVFSRLAWPGYEVSGASLVAPTAKMLVTVHLARVVRRTYRHADWSPPGWRSELAAWWLAVLGGLAWSVAQFVHRTRSRGRVPAALRDSGQVVEDDASVEHPSGGSREDQPDDVR